MHANVIYFKLQNYSGECLKRRIRVLMNINSLGKNNRSS